MHRLAESRLGIHAKHFLRQVEEQRFPRAAKERNFYEKQQELLLNPLTRESYVGNLREKVSQLVPQEFLPDVSLLQAFQPRPEMFLRTHQAYDSDHNIAHHAIVMVGSLLGSRYVQAREPGTSVNEQALLMASSIHDTQRLEDKWESVPPFIEIHAKLAARRAQTLIADMGVNPDMTTYARTQQMLRYHDVDRKQLGDNYTTELGIMVAADRAALGRLFSSADNAIRLVAGSLAARRMRNFKNGGIASDPEVFGTLSEILGALDIMTKEKISNGDKTQQFQYVIDSARELGIIKENSK